LPVANKVLEHIEIHIKDASGISLPFQCGRSSHQWLLRKTGTIGLEARFSAALPEAIIVIVYGEFQNLIEIDHERRATTDY
jgi:hypothetical protein